MKFQLTILFCLTILFFNFILDLKGKIYSQDFLIEEVLYKLALMELQNWSQFEIEIKGFTFVVENKGRFIQITKKDFWGLISKTYVREKVGYAD